MKMRLFSLSLLCAAPLAAADAPRPYLADVPRPDLMRVLPPPPVPGSAEDVADRGIFRRTRALQGTDRWTVATLDVTDDRFTTFACAMGMTLDARRAPALARVFTRMGGVDLVAPVKRAYARRRPYLDDDRPICEPKTAHLAGNGDYPSGHATGGWVTALVLAELMPDRATPILARGRSYGESRYICGSHSASAVEASFIAGSAIVAALHVSTAFRSDMDAARSEIARLRRSPQTFESRRCDLEKRALAE